MNILCFNWAHIKEQKWEKCDRNEQSGQMKQNLSDSSPGALCLAVCAWALLQLMLRIYSVFPSVLWPSLSRFPLRWENISLPAPIKTQFSFCLSPFKTAQLFLNCPQIRLRLSARRAAVSRCRSPGLISLLRRLLTSGALEAHGQMTISAGAGDESVSLEMNSLCERWHQHFL